METLTIMELMRLIGAALGRRISDVDFMSIYQCVIVDSRDTHYGNFVFSKAPRGERLSTLSNVSKIMLYYPTVVMTHEDGLLKIRFANNMTSVNWLVRITSPDIAVNGSTPVILRDITQQDFDNQRVHKCFPLSNRQGVDACYLR